jgi:hypothetical protein
MVRNGAAMRAAFVLLVAAFAGCHTPGAPVPRAPHPVGPVLPDGAREPLEPDVSALPTDAPAPAARPERYRRLTANECRALAVAAAPLASTLDAHPDSVPPAHEKLRPALTKFAHASKLVRGHAADELRSRAAADALTDYFKLAEAEGQLDLLAATDAELRAQLDDAEKALAAGLRDRADAPGLRRKLLDLAAERAKLEAAVAALNASLATKLGLAPNDARPLFPADPLRVKPDDVNADAAVATALQYRSDLNLLRELRDSGSGELADAVLDAANPLLGSVPRDGAIAALCALAKQPEERRAARDRVGAVLSARERQAEAEVRAAVALLMGHRSSSAARALDARAADAKLAEVRTRADAGQSVAAELAVAKLDVLKAKGELLSAAVEWHIAEVKVRAALGALARE